MTSAATIFDTKGFEAASIQDISTAAQVTTGALYFHFKSKEEVASAVVDEQHERSVRFSQYNMAEHSAAIDKMLAAGVAHAYSIQQDLVIRSGLKLTFGVCSQHPTAKQNHVYWLSATMQLISRAQREGDIDPERNAKATAEFVVAAFLGIVHLSFVDPIPELGTRVQTTWEEILRTLLLPNRTISAPTPPFELPVPRLL